MGGVYRAVLRSRILLNETQPMQHTLTQNDLVRYLYGECSPREMVAIRRKSGKIPNGRRVMRT